MDKCDTCKDMVYDILKIKNYDTCISAKDIE